MEQRVKGPAIGMIAAMGLGILGALWGVVASLTGMASPAIPEGVIADPQAAEALRALTGGGGVVINLIYLAIAGFVIYAMMQMMKLKSFGLSLAGVIVGMIPCVSPCCFLGLPIGIWALVVILNDEVKKSFT